MTKKILSLLMAVGLMLSVSALPAYAAQHGEVTGAFGINAPGYDTVNQVVTTW